MALAGEGLVWEKNVLWDPRYHKGSETTVESKGRWKSAQKGRQTHPNDELQVFSYFEHMNGRVWIFCDIHMLKFFLSVLCSQT